MEKTDSARVKVGNSSRRKDDRPFIGGGRREVVGCRILR